MSALERPSPRPSVWVSKLGATLVLTLLLSGCFEEPDCLITATNMLKIVFKLESGAVDPVSFTGITTTGSDTVFYSGGQASTVLLPLNPSATGVRFVFTHSLGVDSLDLSYLAVAELVNPDCGTQLYFKGLEIGLSTFSRVDVKNADLLITNIDTRDVVTNLEIYR
jgi:hypothetical protein